MATQCNFPEITIPNPPDILDAIVAALEALHIPIPEIPTIPFPAAFCPLDD